MSGQILTVKVDVDAERDRLAVWKDGIGWVETQTGDLLRVVLLAERGRILEALDRVGLFEDMADRREDDALIRDIVNDNVRLRVPDGWPKT